jgi:hydroxyacylglutathione hydrolase
MMKIEAIPTFQDNYVWAIHNGRSAILVDPGQAAPILAWLRATGMTAQAILVTHHHHDHVGGIAELLQHASIPVYGPARGAVKSKTVSEGEVLNFEGISLNFKVIDTPGHTLDHVCYLAGNEGDPVAHLFCGDTLFSCGCGRLFEGTPAEMYASLSRLANLPGSTLIYCAHEYTLENIDFALEAEPDNPDLQARQAQALMLRKQGKATLPIALNSELKCNPFLRCDLPALVVAASQHYKKPLKPGLETFAAVRTWRDEV